MVNEGKKNLVLITCDQWRGDWGDPEAPIIDLPVLNSLAANGINARRCIAASPQCMPSRMSWITGLWPSQLGVTCNKVASLPYDAPSIVRNLQQSGWYTALVGKTHWTSHDKNCNLGDNLNLLKNLGFDYAIEIAGPKALRRIDCALTEAWKKEGYLESMRKRLEDRYCSPGDAKKWEVKPSMIAKHLYPDIWIAERSIELIRNMPKRPWFLWISFVGPHDPYDTPRPWAGISSGRDIPNPITAAEWIKRMPVDSELSRWVQYWQGRVDSEQVKKCRMDYADHLRLLNDQIGRLYREIKNRDDSENTGIVFTSDHGDMLGDWGGMQKGTFLESAIRVPWIYKPAKSNQRRSITKALPLTELLQKAFEDTIEGSSNGINVMAWARNCKGAWCEYGDEVAVLQGTKKIVYNERSVIWATDLKADEGEQVNYADGQHISWKIDPRWIQLRKFGDLVRREKRSQKWLWRNLGADL